MLNKVIFVVSVLGLVAADNLVCSDSFCQKYRDENGCSNVALACRAQNSTHNGRLFSAPVACSCCETCIENIEVDDDCTLGSLGSPIPHGRCGPGLTCTIQEDEHTTCQQMTDTACLIERTAYDTGRLDGSLGHLMQRASCDDDGGYSPIKCIPGQICYCIDDEGRRIFGEALNILGIEVLMKCECSRQEIALTTVLNTDMRVPFVRCTETGSFDRLQCIKDLCVCVDAHSGFTTSSVVNITTHEMKTLPCYNGSGYEDNNYHRDCEVQKAELIQKLHEDARKGVFLVDASEPLEFCQPDGYFSRIQVNSTHKFCADKYGKPIGNYAARLKSTEATNMTCNCARVELVLKEKNAFEIPICCPNGNYRKLSCRRGLCYCTDENGNQVTEQVHHDDIRTLECYDDENYC
ncbi:Thyroglobulin type-1 domain-containing protein [Sergentomyia squamirostris]